MTVDSILIVDDDQMFRDALTEALEDEGYDVRVAEDGAAALAMLGTGFRPKAILLDYMMPRVNGPMFVESAKRASHLGDIPIILITADGRAQTKASELGLRRFLQKPLKIDDLLAAIETPEGV
jgi:two-component system response regulator MprA